MTLPAVKCYSETVEKKKIHYTEMQALSEQSFHGKTVLEYKTATGDVYPHYSSTSV
jgi:hypothetical protein